MLKTFLLATAISSFLFLALMGEDIESYTDSKAGRLFPIFIFLIFALSSWGYLRLSGADWSSDPIKLLIPIW